MAGSDRAQTVRIARDRALVRAGSIADGVGDLEQMLDTLSDAGQGATTLADQAREEAATGYYYGARLLVRQWQTTERVEGSFRLGEAELPVSR